MDKLAGVVQTLVGVGSEVVTLGLDQVGRKGGAPVAVVEGQGCGEAWGGDTQQNSIG